MHFPSSYRQHQVFAMLPKPKLLVIEDDPTIIDLMRINFEIRGFEVQGCDRSTRALADSLLELPDVVILDLLMPEATGWDVLERLKANPVTRDIPVIICSVVGGESDKQRAASLGAADYITKPFELHELIDSVRRVTGLKKVPGPVSPGQPAAL